ncbi:MAG: bifunctional 5,10-methylene-tetrahydrofolate dehydrogenase/5,10-methylene-tetrahydrofolate cyclohydrolase, partial [candidate division KSB1 bacterium]|nr:bifunctional 5,10-methylene-tetrahydrofolate dehydrogenase/5,10-methylene-tetrahydrofolate cyclohydrolase [candidate division KSB1 bacterium]
MAGMVLDGKLLAQHIEEALRQRVQRFKDLTHGVTPTLATILVGTDPASATYVRMKRNACKRVGMGSVRLELPHHTTTAELLEHIGRLNDDPAVHGILLQHPVPSHIDERQCFDAITLAKDVDGVTCHGFGRLAMGAPAYGSATPAGIMRLLQHYAIPLTGKRA